MFGESYIIHTFLLKRWLMESSFYHYHPFGLIFVNRKIKTDNMNSKNLILVLFLAFTLPVFAQDPDMSLIPYRQGDLWGYAYPDKSIAFKPEYEEANLFSEGFAVVKKGGKYGYINKVGKVVIPIKYFSAKPFHFGFYSTSGKAKPGEDNSNGQKAVLFAGAAPLANGYEICIDTKGSQLVKCPAISDINVPDMVVADKVTIISNYSTIKKSDLFDKITGDYKLLAGADDTYYIAIRNNNYGVFNNKFEVIVPFEYSMIEKINIGAMVYLKVEKAGLKGIFFGTGSPYLPVENSRIQQVQAANGNNYFIFTKDGLSGIKDNKYKNIVETIYSDIVYDEAGGFILTASETYKGFCFLNQNVLLPRFTGVKLVKGGEFVMVKTTRGKWGYISSNLVEFFED
jgi:hypothetical protein